MKAAKRILVLCPKGDLNSGGVISNFQLIKYLREHGYEVRVITSWKGTYNKTLNNEGISNLAIPYNWWTPLDKPDVISVRSIGAVFEIVDEIKKFKPSVVITNTSHIPWGALAASMTNTPHVWIAREFPINSFGYLNERVHFMMQYSNKIMANSQELADYYSAAYNYDVGKFMSYVDVSDIELGGGSDVIQLVSPNTINVTKNQIDLLDAVGIIKIRRPDLKFKVLLMGEKDMSYWPKIESRIKKHGLQDIFNVFDRVTHPWSKVGVNDIMIQTSLTESIGRTTTEAMKLGIPVIASDIPGHREAFRLGGGTLYELGDANDLADKIEYALDHRLDVQNKALRVQKRALENMSSDACSGIFIDVITELIGKNNPVGVNQQVAPYFQQITSEVNKQQKIIIKKNQETDDLHAEIEAIRNSKAYKIGRAQVNIVKKITNVINRRK